MKREDAEAALVAAMAEAVAWVEKYNAVELDEGIPFTALVAKRLTTPRVLEAYGISLRDDGGREPA